GGRGRAEIGNEYRAGRERRAKRGRPLPAQSHEDLDAVAEPACPDLSRDGRQYRVVLMRVMRGEEQEPDRLVTPPNGCPASRTQSPSDMPGNGLGNDVHSRRQAAKARG